MNIFQKILSPELRKMSGQVQMLEKQNVQLNEMVDKYKQVQELLAKDILTLQEIEKKYTGNDYKDYAIAVQAISDKYNGIADWGCLQTGIVIDLRAAFVLGEGIQITPATDKRKDAEKELQWVNDFFSWNDLDAEMAQELAKEAEIEGKIALKIIYENEAYRDWPGMISVRFISWTAKKYVVTPDPYDYMYYKTIEWAASAKASAEKLTEEKFIYKKFGGRINNPNDAQPRIMHCLTQIDRLDKALRDLREINHLFASPTPDFKMETAEEVKSLLIQLKDVNWKIGKLLAHTGEFSMKGPDMAGVANLISEIEMCVKMISGVTGIPIHFLGLLDLLRNRATGDNTRELVMAATARERMIWKGAYEELISKAMTMFNENVYAQKSEEVKLDPTKISIEIPLITQEQWDRIEKVLIPAAMAGIISKEHVAEQIPGVDLEAEADRKNANEAKEFERMKTEIDSLKADQTFGKGNEWQE